MMVLEYSSFNRSRWRGENRTMYILYTLYNLYSFFFLNSSFFMTIEINVYKWH